MSKESMQQAIDALKWYVDEDDVIESMEGNEFWVEGKRRGQSAIATLEAELAAIDAPDYAELERQHLGDADKKTGIYAQPPSAPPAWMPIETAPKDGTMIDLWCVVPNDSDFIHSEGGIRLTGSWHVADKIFQHTGWVRVLDDGNLDLIDAGATTSLGLPRWTPTHWMSLPKVP